MFRLAICSGVKGISFKGSPGATQCFNKLQLAQSNGIFHSVTKKLLILLVGAKYQSFKGTDDIFLKLYRHELLIANITQSLKRKTFCFFVILILSNGPSTISHLLLPPKYLSLFPITIDTGLYEPLLQENERQAVSELLTFLESTLNHF